MAKSKAATSGVTQDSKSISEPQQSVLQQPKATGSGVVPDPKSISQPQQAELKQPKSRATHPPRKMPDGKVGKSNDGVAKVVNKVIWC